MTAMESLSMLGLSGQARAPTQGPGCGAVTGPPGAAAPASGEHAAFAAALRQLLGGVAARQASPGAAPEEPPATQATAERARNVEEGTDGADAAERPRTRRGAPVSEEPAAAGAAIAPLAMPLDLFEEAASGEPTPEPTRAGAENAPSIAAAEPAAVGPTASVATPAPDAEVAAPTPATDLGIAPAAPERASHEPPAGAMAAGAPATEAGTAGEAAIPAGPASTPAGMRMADREDTPPVGDAAPRAAPHHAGEPRLPRTAEPTPHAVPPDEPRLQGGDPTERAPRAEEQSGSMAARAEGVPPITTAKGHAAIVGRVSQSDARLARDADREVAGEPSRPQESGMPSAGAGDASGAARRSSDATPARTAPSEQPAPAARPAPASARHSEMERPGRRQQGVPAEGAPEVHPGSAHATVVQWLHGSERADEGQALQHAQRILVANLADGIHRLTFVGQSRAVLQLQPPDLGKLSIHLTMQDGGLSVEMVVETEAVKTIVESSLDQLRSALAQHGLATDGVFVQVGESAHRDTAQWQARRGREPRGAPPATGRIGGAAPPPAARHVGHGSTVDYRI